MITEIRSGFHVKRFHTSPRNQEETVGHHSANVCAILLRFDPNCSRELLIHALMHDVAECEVGDMPAPAKRSNPGLRKLMHQAEYAYNEQNDIPGCHVVLSREELALLKVADITDLLLSSLEDLQRGNVYAVHVANNCRWYLEDMAISTELRDKIQQMEDEVTGI